MPEEKSVLREVDAEAIRLARTLLRTARAGALSVIDAQSGAPAVSRVGVATDLDGGPILLISGLAPHTAALRADPR
ncbi:MAG: HugZ family protein, partial [Devosia sp.]